MGERKKERKKKSLLEVQISTQVLKKKKNEKKAHNHPQTQAPEASRQNLQLTSQPGGGSTERTEWSSTFVLELTKEKLCNWGKEPTADLRAGRWAPMNVRLRSPAKGRSPKCWPQPYLIKGQAL